MTTTMIEPVKMRVLATVLHLNGFALARLDARICGKDEFMDMKLEAVDSLEESLNRSDAIVSVQEVESLIKDALFKYEQEIEEGIERKDKDMIVRGSVKFEQIKNLRKNVLDAAAAYC